MEALSDSQPSYTTKLQPDESQSAIYFSNDCAQLHISHDERDCSSETGMICVCAVMGEIGTSVCGSGGGFVRLEHAQLHVMTSRTVFRSTFQRLTPKLMVDSSLSLNWQKLLSPEEKVFWSTPFGCPTRPSSN